jgi:hypothetical protein
MKICYDITLMKPGCVLLAAAMGADTEPSKCFDTEYWLLAPTPNLRVYEINEAQLKQLVTKTKEVRP